jgi:ABC-type multidrug transport system fused ATPase/permease subunit
VQLVFLDVLISVLDILFLVLLLLVINFYTQPAAAPGFSPLPAEVIHRHSLLFIGIFCVLFALKNWFAIVVTKKQFHFVYQVASRISAQKLDEYLEGSYSNYVNLDSSVHLRNIHYDSVDFGHYVLRGCQQALSQCILIVIAFIPVLIFKPALFSLLLLVLIPPVILLAFIIKKRMDSIRNSMKNIQGKIFQFAKEAIAGFTESNIYQAKKFLSNRFINARMEQSDHLSEQQIIQSLPPRIIEVFAIGGLFVLAAINLYITGNSVNVITIGAFIAAAYKIIPGIVKILNSAGQVKAYSFTVKNLLPGKQMAPVEIIDGPVTSIEFQHIFFRYRSENLLTDISFKIEKGDFVGIAGLSGKGKTTLLNLMLGFLTPCSGMILVNGKFQMRGLKPYRSDLSYVKQQPFFINDSIALNIALNEDYDKEKLDRILNITGIKDIVAQEGQTTDMLISENGKNFSGGQRQRLAFARALYKEVDMFLLDEPFSELDNVSERRLLEVLKKMANAGKIIILVTHNKESLSFCNKIIDLDKG